MSKETNVFTLNCGQQIQLVELNQCLTYERLLGGMPCAASNTRLIERAVESAKRPGREGAPYLIEPVQTAIEMSEREKAQDVTHPSPFGTPMVLPPIKCVGRFESVDPADIEQSQMLEGNEDLEPTEYKRLEPFDYRWLVVVWFQAEFALPIDAGVVEKILALDWEKVAQGAGDWTGCEREKTIQRLDLLGGYGEANYLRRRGGCEESQREITRHQPIAQRCR